MEQCTIRDAALKLQAWFAIRDRVEENRPQETPARAKADKPDEEKKPAGPINPPLPFHLRVEAMPEYGLNRGLSNDTLEIFGAGLCISKGTFSGRLVIPLHNEQGDLIGYAGRSLDDSEPRYLFPSRDKGFYKSHLVFNLHSVVEDNSKPFVVLVEGFFSVFKLWHEGIAAVSLLGSSLSEVQEELICQHLPRVVLMFDGDDAGRAATDECLLRLGRRLWVKAISLPDSVQPDQLTSEEIQTMLAASL